MEAVSARMSVANTMDAGGPAMARAPFTFVVPDGAQPGEVIQVQVLGILARVELPEGTFGGQQLTGTYSREAYGKRWQAVLSDERETRRRRLESGKHVPVKSGNHEYDQYVVLSKRVLGQALGFEQCAGLRSCIARRLDVRLANGRRRMPSLVVGGGVRARKPPSAPSSAC